MQLWYERCAGLNVHPQQVVASARIVVDGSVTYHRLTIPATTVGFAGARRHTNR